MKNKLKYILSLAVLGVVSHNVNSQASWVVPEPTDVTGVVRVYIDLSHPDCGCPLLQDWATADVPADEPNLYMWTWQPNDPDGGNGEWTNSNSNNVMTQDSDNPAHWYKEMIPVNFYNTDPGSVYATGISFLIKRRNGAAIDGGEPKSADQNVPLIPLTCVDRVCAFPQKWFQDDYLYIVYDNNQEPNAGLQNLGPDDALIYYRYRINGGPQQTLQGTDERFQLTYDGEGFFSMVMLPEEFFGLNPGEELTEIQVFITKPPINVPPFSIWTLLPGCGE
jgi:hypothetical protein